MNMFQRLAFADISEFLAYLPEEELQLVNEMRCLIGEVFPRYSEKLAYNVPFYYHRKRMCFIWPL